MVVYGTIGLGLTAAQGDESNIIGEPPAAAPTARQTKEALEAAGVGRVAEPAETDLQVAEELPHRGLSGEEALELTDGVFGAELEASAGIYDELEPTKFLSEHAAVVPASSLPEPPGDEPSGQEGAGPPDGLAADQPVLIESLLPLETEDAEGKVEPVDLSLQHPEGTGGGLEPQNPLTELMIPAHLEEGIKLGEFGIEVMGTTGAVAPTDVEERYAFYPNVAENTDLAVAPTPTGVETMTDIRSAEAPRSSTYRLSVPSGATLQAALGGGAEVVEGGRTSLIVPKPSAIDASGAAVPTEMTVEGDELTVSISPDSATRYPVLLDPAYMPEGWNWNEKGQGFNGWSSSTTAPAYSALTYESPMTQPGGRSPRRSGVAASAWRGSKPGARPPTAPRWGCRPNRNSSAKKKAAPASTARRPPRPTTLLVR
ncbi:MAG TPA: hypothetical protein VMF55_16240 [Solirubrobacterales bacterium]|nr:hypothetical protein [Solirubrobacterales bacterium]